MLSYPHALGNLLGGVIDYAGLFPPAKLDMASAVNNYSVYLSGQYRWLLGRFIVPVSRLAEFERVLSGTGNEDGWHISALGTSDPARDVAAVFDFNKRHVAMIDTVEVKASTVDDIKSIASAIPQVLTTFIEIPIQGDPSVLINSIRNSGLQAKVRTGGTTLDAFPTSGQVARFILACHQASVPFKATAGLHHPIRGTYRLTYENGSPSAAMYGFLNVLIAAGVARLGGGIDHIKDALDEASASGFQAGDQEIVWRGYRLNIPGISSLRNTLLTSIGSCSFTEPIQELKSLKLL